MKSKRKQAIIKRNIFLSICGLVLVLFVALIVFIISAVTQNPQENNSSSENILSIESSSSEITSSEEEPEVSGPEMVERGEFTLDANYSNLLLVNGKNPLPDDYDYEGNLTTIPQKYIKGSLTQFDKDAWPYLQAMLDNARKEGIDIGVWSPYRSYATQKWLFEKQVKKQINNGVPEAEAEDKAATIVARPGTSEHNTGLALDINCADHSFKETKAYKWLLENAQDYGFILRYAEDKQEITGVIYESWHWRFVGIKVAKEINDSGLCLEEYIEKQ